MPTYTNATPGSSEILATSQGLMLGNFQYLQTDLSVDHNFTTNTATTADGYHKVIHYVNQGSDPAVVTNIGQLYTKTVGSDQQLFYESGSGIVTQLTGPVGFNVSSPTSGFCSLHGGVILQWGNVTAGATTSGTVTFATPFPTTVFSITLGLLRPSTGTAQAVFINSKTLSTFTWSSTSTNNTSFYFMAVGN